MRKIILVSETGADIKAVGENKQNRSSAGAGLYGESSSGKGRALADLESRLPGGAAAASRAVRPLLRIPEDHLGQNRRRDYSPQRPQRIWSRGLLSKKGRKSMN